MKNLNTYRKTYLKAILFALPLVVLSSCKKEFLDTAPQTSISDATAFDTPTRILNQVNGMYASLKNGQFMGGRYVVYGDIRGEDFLVNKPNGVTGLDTWSFNVGSNSNEVKDLWRTIYAVVNQANILIKGIAEHPNVVSATVAKQYVAEAKLLRALSYFDLLQLYAKPYTLDNGVSLGVPLRLNAETGTENQALKRSTVAEVYAQILKDLNDAETDLLLTNGTAVGINVFRAHKNTAIALKTRVYLAMGNYPAVITEGAKIVSLTAPYQAPTGINNKLEANVITVFGGSYVGAEAIFSLPMTDTDAPGTQNQLGYYFNISPGNSEYYMNPAGILANTAYAAASTDARKSLTAVVSGNTFVTKYKKASPFTDYVPVIRYAEVLLNVAEATARVGADLPRAIALLTAVHQRSDAAFIFPPASIATQSALISSILTERRIELIGEGLRSMDIMRTNANFPAKSGTQGSAPLVLPTDAKYIWPISSIEIQTNSACVQNP